MKAKTISKTFIDDLINRTDIADLIDSYVPLKKAGKSFKACCPFHSEKTPSFTVTPSKGNYFCFGCGANGNPINFLMEYSNIDFPSAVETLASFAGVQVQYEISNQKAYATEKERGNFLSKLNGFFLEQRLSNENKVLKINGDLGLVNDAFSSNNEIGFLPNSAKVIEFIKENELFSLAKKYGVINKSDKMFAQSNAPVFPIKNKDKIQGFITVNSTGKHLTIPGGIIFDERASLIGMESAKGNDNDQPIYVVSSFSEKLKLEDIGISNVICNAYRDSPLTKSQYKTITSKNQKNIFFIFENNEESRESTSQLVESFVSGWSPNQESQIKVLFVPEEESLSSIIKKISLDKLSYLHSKAIDLPSYFLSSLSSKVPAGDAGMLLSHAAPILLSSGLSSRHLHDALLDEAVAMFSVDKEEFINLYTEYLFDKNPYHWFLNYKEKSLDENQLGKTCSFNVNSYLYDDGVEDHILLAAIYEVACAGGLTSQDIKMLSFVPLKHSESDLIKALSKVDLEGTSVSNYLSKNHPEIIEKVEANQDADLKTPIYYEHVVDELLMFSFDMIRKKMEKTNRPQPMP